MDNESFQLCKELYERMGWRDVAQCFRPTPVNSGANYRLIQLHPSIPQDIPLYTSDYLLEKLPRTFGGVALALWAGGAKGWIAEYDGKQFMRSHGSDPRKALLKLTLDLHEAGELK